MVVNLFENERAERAVIAALIQDQDLDVNIPLLSEDDFNTTDYKCLFEALRLIHSQKGNCTDLVTISETLAKLFGAREPALTDLVIRILNDQVLAKYSYSKHVEILKKATERRRLFTVLDEAKKELRGDAETGAVLEKTRQALRNIREVKQGWKSNVDVLANTYNAIIKRSEGKDPLIPSGIEALDKITTGFHKGELTIIGARPGIGKSALAMHIVIAAATAGHKVGVCSREMTDIQYGQRMIQRSADVEANKLRTGKLESDEWGRVAEAMSLYSSLPISYLFSVKEVEELQAQVQQKIDTDGLDLLVVDYAQLMRTQEKFTMDYQRIGHITKTLKDMTVDLNLSIIALAQVGRSSANDMPTLEELRGSGDIEQDADVVVFLHRVESDDDKWVRPEHRQSRIVSKFNAIGAEYIAIKIAKQRQGQTGVVATMFRPDKMRYAAIDERVGE